MQKKQLNNLAQYSYTNGQLDETRVTQIADRLSRADLKQYLKLLRHEQLKKIVIVRSATVLSETDRERISKLYPNKQVQFSVDKAMLAGIKIIEDDQETEINLDSTFHDIMVFLNKE